MDNNINEPMLNGVNLNIRELNRVNLNSTSSTIRRVVPDDGTIPDGYEEFLTADSEVLESAKGSFFIKAE